MYFIYHLYDRVYFHVQYLDGDAALLATIQIIFTRRFTPLLCLSCFWYYLSLFTLLDSKNPGELDSSRVESLVFHM